MKNKIILTMLLGVFLLGNILALECDGNNIGTFKPESNINLMQTCDACTYVTLNSINYPNSTIVYINTNMTQSGVNYNYTFNTNVNGDYYYTVFGDKNGLISSEVFCFRVGDEFGYWFILIGTILAIIFFIASLTTPEEFFVYISGVLFLIEGIYIMINGFSLVNDVNTRMIAIVYLGIGLLFTLGAYIYDWVSNSNKEEEEEY